MNESTKRLVYGMGIVLSTVALIDDWPLPWLIATAYLLSAGAHGEWSMTKVKR